jgi:hypothetical protein
VIITTTFQATEENKENEKMKSRKSEKKLLFLFDGKFITG